MAGRATGPAPGAACRRDHHVPTCTCSRPARFTGSARATRWGAGTQLGGAHLPSFAPPTTVRHRSTSSRNQGASRGLNKSPRAVATHASTPRRLVGAGFTREAALKPAPTCQASRTHGGDAALRASIKKEVRGPAAETRWGHSADWAAGRALGPAGPRDRVHASAVGSPQSSWSSAGRCLVAAGMRGTGVAAPSSGHRAGCADTKAKKTRLGNEHSIAQSEET